MIKRYKLSDSFWEMIEDLVTQDQKKGRPRHDDRLMLNGILWVLCSGAAWRDMPERFGPWSQCRHGIRCWLNAYLWMNYCAIRWCCVMSPIGCYGVIFPLSELLGKIIIQPEFRIMLLRLLA